MSFHFYLFDVNHGQSAAARLPNGRWCIFDAGCSTLLSPTRYILGLEPKGNTLLTGRLVGNIKPFNFLKATISHLHGDHLADYRNIFLALPEFLKTIDYDQEYLTDVFLSSARESWDTISAFCSEHGSQYGAATAIPDYGGVTIMEWGLTVSMARSIGGSANSRVNNASIVTRINCDGNSILLCGDMETEAWDFVLNRSRDKTLWQALVVNIDVLVAPHHGHSSGYSVDLMKMANPSVVLVSVETGDENVDTRYSGEVVNGITVNGQPYKSITTRKNGTIHLEINPPLAPATKGVRTWYGL
jgi:beta-lactamase superfamily II metal-dependent hydrolase